MQFITPTFTNLLWLPAVVVIFLLPGWLLVQRIGSSLPTISAFLASAIILFQLALLFDAFSIPLHRGTLAVGIATISLLLSWRTRRQSKPVASPPAVVVPCGWDWIWVVPCGLAITSIVSRAIIDPLSGYDNGTRWDYLARLFLAHQSLAGYPPITASDFELYSWCDGIPPLIPLLNFWIYTVTGSIAPALTAVRVTAEALLLGGVVFRYSCLLWGERAGWPALAALSSSALALWAIAMGQETGLTALSLVAMLYFIELHTRERRLDLLICAGLAAGVGALSREYGLAYMALGIFVLFCRGSARKGILVFSAVAAGIATPWYLRNWLITGNPLYPQPLGGIFRNNPIYDEIMRYIGDYWGLGSGRHDVRVIPKLIFVLAGTPVTLGLFGAWRKGRESLPLVGGITLIVAFWLWSIPQTAGGWTYSLRVLLPAVSLLAVLAGGLVRSGRTIRIAFFVVSLGASCDAARRSWELPDLPFESPLGFSFSSWKEDRDAMQRIGANPLWDVLVRSADGRGIVVDHTAHHALITMRGGVAVPLFSPSLAVTFDAGLRFTDVVQRLRGSGIRYITISVKNSISRKLVEAHPFWAELCFQHQPLAEVQALAVFDLDNLKPYVRR